MKAETTPSSPPVTSLSPSSPLSPPSYLLFLVSDLALVGWWEETRNGWWAGTQDGWWAETQDVWWAGTQAGWGRGHRLAGGQGHRTQEKARFSLSVL